MTIELSALPADVRSLVQSQSRLDALRELDAVALEDSDLDRLVRLAAGGAGTSMAGLRLIAADEERFACLHGMQGKAAPLGLGAFTIAGRDSCMVLPDTLLDGRFAAEMLGDTRFYAGVPVIVHGQKLAALCVMDEHPRAAFGPRDCSLLLDLAGVCGSLLELKREAAVRDRIAAELMREKWRHALTLEVGQVSSWTFNLVTGTVTGNEMLRQMYGLPSDTDMRIDDLLARTDPAGADAFIAALERSVTQDADFVVEFRLLSGRWLSARGRLYDRDELGRPELMMGITIDMTEAREAAEHTRHLLLELNHRVKNTLAMTQSIARQTLRQKPDPQEFIDSFSGRIRTLADAHTLLADRDWAGIGIVELVQSQVEPYALAVGERLRVAGDDVQLPPDHALGLGIILHELASNAARHGALSGEHGQVEVRWDIADGRLVLDWREQGGPAVSVAPLIGLGSRLIHRSLDKILGSQVRLDFLPGGVQARIELPLG